MLFSSLRAGMMAEIRTVGVKSGEGVCKRVAVRCNGIYHRMKAYILTHETENLHGRYARSRGGLAGVVRQPELQARNGEPGRVDGEEFFVPNGREKQFACGPAR